MRRRAGAFCIRCIMVLAPWITFDNSRLSSGVLITLQTSSCAHLEISSSHLRPYSGQMNGGGFQGSEFPDLLPLPGALSPPQLGSLAGQSWDFKDISCSNSSSSCPFLIYSVCPMYSWVAVAVSAASPLCQP